ncbi:MAG: hypothetical protein IPG53_20470 [Ignavibacteriales bacterium]|nr:hypothetical protein [Ignavibacteriales bacterium]
MVKIKDSILNLLPSGLATMILNSGYFFATSVVGMLISFVSFPLFVVLLSKEDFGVLAFFTALNNIIAQFSILSLTNYYIVRSRELAAPEKRQLLLNLMLFNFFWNLLLTVDFRIEGRANFFFFY